MNLLTGTAQEKQRISDIKARHADLMELEKSIRELHDLFLEMAALTEQQNGIARRDVGQNRVSCASEKARLGVHQAEDLSKRARRRKIYIIICSLTVIIRGIALWYFVVI